MFNKLQQLGKTLTDEIEHAVKSVNDQSQQRPNAGPSSTAARSQQRQGPAASSTSNSQRSAANTKKTVAQAFDTLKANAAVLHEQTPDPDSLDITLNDSASRPGTPQAKAVGDVPPADKDASSPDTKSATEDQQADGSSAPNKDDSSEAPVASSSSSTAETLVADSALKSSGETVQIDGLAVPKELLPKLRKFKKYEAKYPGMLKTEEYLSHIFTLLFL